MSGSLHEVAAAWWQWIAGISIQVAWLALAVLLLDRLLARRSWPELRAALWCAVIIKLVLPPTLSSPLSVTRLGPGWQPPWLPPSSEVNGGMVVAAFFLWIVGVLVLAAIAARRHRRLRSGVLAGARRSAPPDLHRAAHDAAARLGLRRPPRLLVADGASGPAVIGVLRPTVILPTALIRHEQRVRWEHVLLHEFAHVKRRDPLASGLCQLLQLVYWFHPLVWLARHELARLREIRCDQTVASVLGHQTPAYRDTLLELSRPLLRGRRPVGVGFLHPRSLILARLEFLDRCTGEVSRLQRPAAVTLLALLLFCCVPLAPQPFPSSALSAAAIEELPGCLQKRFAVLHAMSLADPQP